mmetsp:Transcript_6595/g.21296  ORF Transcript_6595/g.21296 Transcript_6595/m.21296 type:complete len:273 (-) Transcript_6595:925-1743(-)
MGLYSTRSTLSRAASCSELGSSRRLFAAKPRTSSVSAARGSRASSSRRSRRLCDAWSAFSGSPPRRSGSLWRSLASTLSLVSADKPGQRVGNSNKRLQARLRSVSARSSVSECGTASRRFMAQSKTVSAVRLPSLVGRSNNRFFARLSLFRLRSRTNAWGSTFSELSSRSSSSSPCSSATSSFRWDTWHSLSQSTRRLASEFVNRGAAANVFMVSLSERSVSSAGCDQESAAPRTPRCRTAPGISVTPSSCSSSSPPSLAAASSTRRAMRNA